MKNNFFGKKINSRDDGNDEGLSMVTPKTLGENSDLNSLIEDIGNLKLHLMKNGLNGVSEDRILDAINMLSSKQYDIMQEFSSINNALKHRNEKAVVETLPTPINTRALENKIETMIEKFDSFSASLSSVNSKISALEFKLDRIANDKYSQPSINPYKIEEIDQKSNQMLVKIDRALEKISTPKDDDFTQQFEIIKDGIRGLSAKIKESSSRELVHKVYLEMNAYNDVQREKTDTLVDNIKNIEQVLEKLDIIRDEVVSASYNDLSRELSQISKFLSEDEEALAPSVKIDENSLENSTTAPIIEEVNLAEVKQVEPLMVLPTYDYEEENSQIIIDKGDDTENKIPNLIELCSFSLEEAVKDIINGDDK